MRKNRLFIILLALSLAMLACNFPTQPTTTEVPALPATLAPLPEGSDPSCLYGSWQVVDLSSYILASIPQETVEEYNLQYQGSSGAVTIAYDPSGFFGLNASDFKLNFNSKVSILTVPLTISLSGTATGSYTVDGNVVTTQNMDTSGLSASAEAAGQQLVEPEDIIGAIPMLHPPYNQAVFICEGNSLQLTITNYPENIPPMLFQRIQ